MKHLLLTTIAAVLVVGCGGPSGIHKAASNGNIEAVKQHLDAGTDIELKCTGCGGTALGHAAKHGHKEIVELLIAEGAGVNAKKKGESTPLHNAAWGGNKEIIELLIAEGADVNAKGLDRWTPLHSALRRGHKEVAELLIAKGADVNAKKKGGSAPLHMATALDHKEIAELLIANGADVNVKGVEGWTPLDIAIQQKQTADLLRKHGGKTKKELEAAGN